MSAPFPLEGGSAEDGGGSRIPPSPQAAEFDGAERRSRAARPLQGRLSPSSALPLSEGEGAARLIVTADDFGASTQVNAAVEQAFSHGVLRAASLMVAASGCADAVARAKRLPGLRVGLHLVLVEGRARLPHADLPDLTTPDGRFRRDMAAAAVDIFFKPAARRQLLAEVRAQFAAYAATGLPLDHVNTHKHFHLHPTIAGAILRVGREHGLAASRAPVEPLSVLRAVDARATPRSAWLTDPWARLVRARFRARGVVVADQVFGLAWSGAMTAERVAGLIARLPPGLTELYTHPATAGGWEGEAPGYRYAEELAALTSPQVIEAVRERGAVLGGFSDFA